jgi:5'-3' exonuclease
MTNYVLIDGSYYIFYRYYALNVWWKLVTLSVGENENIDNAPIDSPEFVDKFKTTFVNKIHDINKKLKIKNSIKYVGKDCKRHEIWRTKLFPEYKANRDSSNKTNKPNFQGSPFFNIVEMENLYENAGVKQILYYPSLEADDCIALFAKHLYKTDPDAHIWIIASDMDYLQITNDRIHLYDLKFKNVKESKNSTGDPKCDLFCKIVAGDKSDNIPSIFKKCGIKTAQKYFKDKDLFEKMLEKNKEAQELYKLNTTLVDFNSIPSELVEGFMNKYTKETDVS